MRRRAWATGAAIFIGLGAAAATVPFHGHTAAQSLLAWFGDGSSAHAGVAIARGDGTGGRAAGTGGMAAGGDAAPPADDGVTPTFASAAVAAPRDGGSGAAARGVPGMAGWSAATVADVVGPADAGPGNAESVVTADGTSRDGTAPAVVADPAAMTALAAAAAAPPFAGQNGAAVPASGGGGFYPAAGGGTGGGGAPDNGTPTGGTGGGGTATVPEPATWLLLIAGFGLVGAAQRRRPARPRYSGVPANSASR